MGDNIVRATAANGGIRPVSYTHLRAHETDSYLVCRLLLDEPTAGLDWSMKNDVKNLIFNLKNKNTIIIVTHEPSLFEGIPSKILFLEQGKIKELTKGNYGG